MIDQKGDVNMDEKYKRWLDSLPKHDCYVRAKYKPEYYGGKEETLKWVPKCNATLFWREDSDGSMSIWWRLIESFFIFIT